MARELWITGLFFCSCMFLFVPLLMICSTLLETGLLEREKYTYVKGDCLVTNSSLKKCGVFQSIQGKEQCYLLRWRIEYLQYQTDKRTTIPRSYYYLKGNTSWEVKLKTELENYQVWIW